MKKIEFTIPLEMEDSVVDALKESGVDFWAIYTEPKRQREKAEVTIHRGIDYREDFRRVKKIELYVEENDVKAVTGIIVKAHHTALGLDARCELHVSDIGQSFEIGTQAAGGGELSVQQQQAGRTGQ